MLPAVCDCDGVDFLVAPYGVLLLVFAGVFLEVVVFFELVLVLFVVLFAVVFFVFDLVVFFVELVGFFVSSSAVISCKYTSLGGRGLIGGAMVGISELFPRSLIL